MRKFNKCQFIYILIFIVSFLGGIPLIVVGGVNSYFLTIEEYDNQIALYGFFKEDIHTLVDYQNRLLSINIFIAVGLSLVIISLFGLFMFFFDGGKINEQ